MKKYLILILILCSSLEAKTLSALWWNVGGNAYSDDLGDYTSLDATFAEKDFSTYDFIALGEFNQKSFDPVSLVNITQHFPYQKQFYYNKKSKSGIFVLSKFPFTYKNAPLDWMGKDFTQQQRNDYLAQAQKIHSKRYKNFERTYHRITVNQGSKKLHLVFYHFNNPWPGYNDTFGNVRAAWEILFGKKNPLMYQLEHFETRLKQDLGEKYRRKNLIMLGDANCPYRIKGLASMCIRRMQRHLPLVLDRFSDFTFPSPYYSNAATYPRVKIDHAQVSVKILNEELEVLDWEGSDHLPINLKFELN